MGWWGWGGSAVASYGGGWWGVGESEVWDSRGIMGGGRVV